MGSREATSDRGSGGGATAEMEVLLKILFTSLCHTDLYFWGAKVKKYLLLLLISFLLV